MTLLETLMIRGSREERSYPSSFFLKEKREATRALFFAKAKKRVAIMFRCDAPFQGTHAQSFTVFLSFSFAD